MTSSAPAALALATNGAPLARSAVTVVRGATYRAQRPETNAPAGDAARDAAGDAAREFLAPTVAECQASAIDLVKRLCAIGRAE